MKVKLSKNLTSFLDLLIKRGYYSNESEALAEGIKLLAERWKCGYCSAYTINFIKEIFSMCEVKKIQYKCPRHGKVIVKIPKIRRITVPKELANLGLNCKLCGELCCDYTDESYGDIYTKSLLINIPSSLLKRANITEMNLILDDKVREAFILIVEDEPCPFLEKSLCSFYFEKAQDKRHPLCISSPFRFVIKNNDLLWTFVKPHEKCQVELVKDGNHFKKSLKAWFDWTKTIAEDLEIGFKPPKVLLVDDI
ncbi:MAG: ribbon-helix-helix domain-containing protein [Nitrososphaerales archaeon]